MPIDHDIDPTLYLTTVWDFPQSAGPTRKWCSLRDENGTPMGFGPTLEAAIEDLTEAAKRGGYKFLVIDGGEPIKVKSDPPPEAAELPEDDDPPMKDYRIVFEFNRFGESPRAAVESLIEAIFEEGFPECTASVIECEEADPDEPIDALADEWPPFYKRLLYAHEGIQTTEVEWLGFD